MKRFLLFAAAASLIIPAATAQTTQKFTASKSGEYALAYSLPRTAVDVTVEAEFTEKTPGEFYNYARRYLNITDAITAPSTQLQVKSVVIGTHGEADDSNRWQVQFKSGSTPYMILNESGCMLSLNTDEIADEVAVDLPVPVAAKPTPLEVPAAREAMTQEMIQSSSTSKRAELAAQRIVELREMRSDLISGQADNTPPDGLSLQLALENLSAQEAALTAMFAGTVKTYTRVYTATVVPDDSEDISGKVISRISLTDGFVDVDDLSGEPVTINITAREQASLPVNEKGEEKKFPKGGVSYTIPGTADVTVYFRDSVVARATVDMAQQGVTFGLDPGLFTDKKAPSKLQLDPATGAVLLLGPAGE